MAGTGYFAAQMERAGIETSCFDRATFRHTYTEVKNKDALAAVADFKASLPSGAGPTISDSAMVIDSPPPFPFSSKHQAGQHATVFLSRLITSWFNQGGRTVVVLSEAAGEDQLFSPLMLGFMNIRMKPIEPGFSEEIYRGLGDVIGVCGAYTLTSAINGDSSDPEEHSMAEVGNSDENTGHKKTDGQETDSEEMAAESTGSESIAAHDKANSDDPDEHQHHGWCTVS